MIMTHSSVGFRSRVAVEVLQKRRSLPPSFGDFSCFWIFFLRFSLEAFPRFFILRHLNEALSSYLDRNRFLLFLLSTIHDACEPLFSRSIFFGVGGVGKHAGVHVELLAFASPGYREHATLSTFREFWLCQLMFYS